LVPVQNLRLAVIIALYRSDAAFGRAAGPVLAVQKPGTELAVILSGINQRYNKFIIRIL
jgi:hypothetical protein